MDEARKGELSGESESIEAQMYVSSQRVSDSRDHTDRSRRESNPHLRFRKPPFYPLNYGNNFRDRMSEIRCQMPSLTQETSPVNRAVRFSASAS